MKAHVPCAVAMLVIGFGATASAQPPPPTTGPSPPAETSPAPPLAVAPPSDARAALDRATAAYEYGDMEQVVSAARPVADGALPASDADRAEALRLSGIALHITGRMPGAENAFFQLLRLRPHTRLDPTTTRPEVVAFFEEIRRRRAAELRPPPPGGPGRHIAWNFVPPAGQFQNGDTAKGWTFAALEAITFGGALATRLTLEAWRGPGDTFGRRADDARTLRTLNAVSVALLVGTLVVAVVDGLVVYRARATAPEAAAAEPGSPHARF